MSYPIGIPSSGVANIWEGNFTPSHVVGAIIDDITPINKNNMRLSVGKQISMVQNFVNSNYLGRSNVPVNSGYINYLQIYNNINCNGTSYLVYIPRYHYNSLNGTGIYLRENRDSEGDTEYRSRLRGSELYFFFSGVAEALWYSTLDYNNVKFNTISGYVNYSNIGISANRDLTITNLAYSRNIYVSANYIHMSGNAHYFHGDVYPQPNSNNLYLGGAGAKWGNVYSVLNYSDIYRVSPGSQPDLSNGTTTAGISVSKSFYTIVNENDVAATVTLTNSLSVNSLCYIAVRKHATYTGQVILTGDITQRWVGGVATNNNITLDPGFGMLFIVADNKLNPIIPSGTWVG